MQKIFSNTNQTRSIYFKLKQISIQKSCRLFSSVDDSKQHSLPRQADVVIAGGGVVACSIAYHLANRGLTNVLVLEKEKFGESSSWIASGVMSHMRANMTETQLVNKSYHLYKKLHEQGHDIGWQICGSLNLCRTRDRVSAYKRSLIMAETLGWEGEFLPTDQIKYDFPHMKTDDLLGGMYMPTDAFVDCTKLVHVLISLCKKKGVKFMEHCEVERVDVRSKMVEKVVSGLGEVKCRHFINATGQWARELGKRTSPYGINIPVHSSRLSEMTTTPLDMLEDETPNTIPFTRDYDGFIYFREVEGCLLAGGFPPFSKPSFHYGTPKDLLHKSQEEDWDAFYFQLHEVLHRMPFLKGIKATSLRTGSESFTPDGRPIIGKVPELLNYYVAAGMNCAGVNLAGGVGEVMAEWVAVGEPNSINVWSCDVRRFVGLHNNRRFLKQRVSETSSHVACIPYWEADMIGWESGRRLRTSSIFTRNENYAVFGQIMGYERPLFFHTQESDLVEGVEGKMYADPPKFSWNKGEHSPKSGLPFTGTYGKPRWFEMVRSEYWACREGVSIIDMSTYSKFELRSAGSEVVAYLQNLCSNDVDKPVGSIIHTGMQNDNGGFENDCSVIRLQHNKYFIIGPTVQQTRSFAWMRIHLPKDGSVQLNDVTSMYTALNVIGPGAQELLSELTETSLKKKDFMYMTHKEINLAMASHVRAMRLTHTGEDGWVLYMPSEFGLHVHDTLQSQGRNFGLRSAGYYALRMLRMEKFFPLWGTDLSPLDTPYECGREYRVNMQKPGGFKGYEALLQQKLNGIKKRLVLLLVEDHDVDNDPWPWVGEAIYRNGKRCGLTTSATYSFGFEKPICFGFIQDMDDKTGEERYLTNNFLVKNARYEVNIGGKFFPAKTYLYAPVLPGLHKNHAISNNSN